MYMIEGIERRVYTNKNNRQVSGWRVHFSYDLPEGGEHDGRAVDTVFLSDTDFLRAGVHVGDAAMPIYNKYGRCTGFMDCTGGALTV